MPPLLLSPSLLCAFIIFIVERVLSFNVKNAGIYFAVSKIMSNFAKFLYHNET